MLQEVMFRGIEVSTVLLENLSSNSGMVNSAILDSVWLSLEFGLFALVTACLFAHLSELFSPVADVEMVTPVMHVSSNSQ